MPLAQNKCYHAMAPMVSASPTYTFFLPVLGHILRRKDPKDKSQASGGEQKISPKNLSQKLSSLPSANIIQALEECLNNTAEPEILAFIDKVINLAQTKVDQNKKALSDLIEERVQNAPKLENNYRHYISTGCPSLVQLSNLDIPRDPLDKLHLPLRIFTVTIQEFTDQDLVKLLVDTSSLVGRKAQLPPDTIHKVFALLEIINVRRIIVTDIKQKHMSPFIGLAWSRRAGIDDASKAKLERAIDTCLGRKARYIPYPSFSSEEKARIVSAIQNLVSKASEADSYAKGTLKELIINDLYESVGPNKNLQNVELIKRIVFLVEYKEREYSKRKEDVVLTDVVFTSLCDLCTKRGVRTSFPQKNFFAGAIGLAEMLEPSSVPPPGQVRYPVNLLPLGMRYEEPLARDPVGLEAKQVELLRLMGSTLFKNTSFLPKLPLGNFNSCPIRLLKAGLVGCSMEKEILLGSETLQYSFFNALAIYMHEICHAFAPECTLEFGENLTYMLGAISQALSSPGLADLANQCSELWDEHRGIASGGKSEDFMWAISKGLNDPAILRKL